MGFRAAAGLDFRFIKQKFTQAFAYSDGDSGSEDVRRLPAFVAHF
jgi:hypothetical protein